MTKKKDHHNAKNIAPASLSVEEQSQMQQQLASYRETAQSLHQSGDEAQIAQALAPITSIAEAAQMALVKALSKEQTIESADVLSALYARSPLKEVRKEARRSLIRLEAAKIYPQWEPPPPPKLMTALEDTLTSMNPPRFWKGLVTDSKKTGEVQLMLYWEQGEKYKDVRVMGFLLEFWHDGVKDFFTEVDNRRQAEKQLEFMHSTEIRFLDCTVGQGKRLLEEALEINQRAGTRPHKDYTRHFPLIRQLILETDTTDSEETMTGTPPFDDELPFIPPDLHELLEGSEAEDTAATFLDEWAKGNYEEAYDLLASTSPLREGLSREEWIERRQQWSAQAQPLQLKVAFIQERQGEDDDEEEDEFEGPYTVEIGWSLAHGDSPLASTMKELPTETTSYAETGRRWFWTSYTLVDEEGELRIEDMTDEGALAQQLPQEELEQRVTEIAELVNIRAQEMADDEDDDEDEEDEDDDEDEDEDEELDEEDEFLEMIDRVQEAMRLTTVAMHYTDALIAHTPDDASLYELAYDQAEAIQEHERAATYMQRMAEHCPDQRGEALRKLAIAFFSISETYTENDDEEQAQRYLTRAEQTVRDSLVADKAPFGQILLAQILIAQNKQIDEAEDLLRQAQSSTLERHEETLVAASFARIAHDRGDKQQALQHYQHAADISPDFPGIWFNLGHLQRELNLLDEAEKSYLRSIEEEPAHIEAYLELAYLYVELKHDLNKAQEVLEDGLEINPASPELLATLALVYIQGGDLREAKELLDEAEEIDPDLEIVQEVRRIYEAQRAQRQASKPKSKQHKRKK